MPVPPSNPGSLLTQGGPPPKRGYPPLPGTPPGGGGVQEIQGSLRTPPTKRPEIKLNSEERKAQFDKEFSELVLEYKDQLAMIQTLETNPDFLQRITLINQQKQALPLKPKTKVYFETYVQKRGGSPSTV